MKFVVFMCRTIKILLSNWPWTRFSELLQAGKRFWRFSPSSKVGQDLPTMVSLSNYSIWCLSFSLSYFMNSSIVYVASLCTFVRSETIIWPSNRFDSSLQNFKRPLDIFSLQIGRKHSEEYLVKISAVKKI